MCKKKCCPYVEIVLSLYWRLCNYKPLSTDRLLYKTELAILENKTLWSPDHTYLLLFSLLLVMWPYTGAYIGNVFFVAMLEYQKHMLKFI